MLRYYLHIYSFRFLEQKIVHINEMLKKKTKTKLTEQNMINLIKDTCTYKK